jgi:ABC-type transporter Mla maintaining outer membrane lipid asymmetry ATPase subunit MlaF
MPDKIDLKSVSYSYRTFSVFGNIDLSVCKGDVVLVGGRSGHGKSTLLEICAGLLTPDSGSVSWDGKDLSDFSRDELMTARYVIGYVFQAHALISNHSIYENIALPLRARQEFSNREIDRKVRSIMDELHLHNVERLFPEVLSAGQLKAVSLARALVTEPEMLFLDEPLSGIDPVTSGDLLTILHEYQRRRQATIIMACHDQGVWDHLPVRKLILDNGRFLETKQDITIQEKPGV